MARNRRRKTYKYPYDYFVDRFETDMEAYQAFWQWIDENVEQRHYLTLNKSKTGLQVTRMNRAQLIRFGYIK